MVLRPAAEGKKPISGSCGVHASDWPLDDPQRDLESGLSRVHANEWPLRESQADLEAGRAYQEKPHSAFTASQPPPAYLSSISSPIESLYAPRPDTTNNNMEDVGRGQASVEPQSAERQRETIRTMVESAVVEQLAKREDEEAIKDFISKVILYTLIFGFIYFVC